MIAPLLDDIETDVGYYFGEDVYIHQPSSDSICIRWCGEDYWSAQTNVGGNPVNIELILYSNGNIQFNYGEGNIGMSPDIGISAGDGVNYVISAHNGSNNLNNAQSCRFIFLKPEDAYNASDELYISFNVSETLASDPTVEIDSISATKLSGAGNAYKYNYDITGSETEGTLPVTITGYDFANNQGTDTSQNVTFDFTAPSFQTVTVTDPDIYYKPGDTLTIQATMTETGLTLMADLSVLDSALAPVAQLTDNGDNTYTLTTGTLTEATMVEGTGITVEINARDAAVVGSFVNKDQNPKQPILPEEVRDAFFAAIEAGASGIHVHVRDRDERPTARAEIYREVLDPIIERYGDDIVIDGGTMTGRTFE